MHYAVPRILARSGQLEQLFTDFYLPRSLEKWKPHTKLFPKLLSRALGRHCEGLNGARVHSNPLLAVSYAARIRITRHNGECSPAYLWAGINFQRWVAKRLNSSGWPEAIYAYNTAARDLFQQAANRGTYRILEQTIAPLGMEREIVATTAALFPEWSLSDSKTSTAQRHLEEREREEWALADRIICGSEFVASALRKQGVPGYKIHVVAYGYTMNDRFNFTPPPATHDGPLRILCAGTVGLRKGTPSLIAAAKKLGTKVDVTLAGSWDAPTSLIADLPANVHWLGSVPRARMTSLYEQSDVFVLPTLCEGSATVCYEACAHGLPIVTTLNSGFPIDEGVNGLIVPLNEPESLAWTLELLNGDRLLLQTLAANIYSRRGNFSFVAYEQRLLNALLPDKEQQTPSP
ncbi:glycosyltransferase family 4 protein [soil metagenome]